MIIKIKKPKDNMDSPDIGRELESKLTDLVVISSSSFEGRTRTNVLNPFQDSGFLPWIYHLNPLRL